ncbi:unannotated protein [freshwater metagenome]|uniref:Unannotated protein n=1 Tax=freshwater metagenome TaxID=449393 RepID=A0A6J6LB63_9ZZZZ|nr:methylmalonyl Co-A mutase-associated GTPase MeaB [Actinomycetota bacterium]MSY37248.1 methylmalonyl Co-A mutase-associated GTPase MeaB [Actinomycetota bacterium]
MTVVSMHEPEWQALLKSVSLKSPRELARAISYAENELTVQVPSSTSASRVIGITGSPGVGKSTTVNALITSLRSEGKTIAVLAVDPSSPISGGALLGDRIRLGEHFLDPHVFIRSIATRGHLGGLSATIESIINIVKLAGFDYIFVETVGVGQSEVEVMKFVETVVVVMAPGMGDGIQASKAGILEIGDIFLVNKSDRDGAKETAKELESSLHLSAKPLSWIPLVLLGAMEKSVGITELISAINQHGEKSK